MVEDALHAGFFFDLLIDEPFEHALRCIVALVEGNGVEVVDEERDLLLVLEGVFEHGSGGCPLGFDLIDGTKFDASATRYYMIEEHLCMVLLFFELHMKPMCHACEALGVAICRHRQIEICRPHLGIDVRI